jgi:lysozyme family protein
MKSNEAQVLEWIYKSEGGFIESPSEPGGAANFGITFQTLADWRALKKGPKPSILDLKGIDKEEATEIYAYKYFRIIRFDELPSGVDYCVLDAAIQHGCSGSIKLLQRCMGFEDEEPFPNWKGPMVTGDLDLTTMWAVNSRNPQNLIKEFIDERADRHKEILEAKDKTIPGFKDKWKSIWKRRRERVLERSLLLSGAKNG